ncbi:ABC transporter permease [Haloactinomyces albus]|uniref:ABC-type nitrate/sulfonate/bicarbonate transport system permease component n=1 Tax=Haloactinomyces albus TaxID=1352928 RepID=A0AAE3ZAW6_9ACTN|nr:ABC transporter permease [Haloactinomyces albus]MDR7301536.1 ABC-type nitrate/sulfonate/bicarbonate transport system permease component [Haloactinomyces albus]
MSAATRITDAAPARLRNRFGRLAQQWTVFFACVLGWQLATVSAQSLFFPTPLEIGTRMWSNWFSGPAGQVFLTDAAFADIFPSVGRLLLGWLLAAVVGVTVGLLLGRSHNAMAYCGPLLSFARSIPPPALVPVFLVLFSIGFRMQLATIIFGSIWPVLLNSADGARAVDTTKAETARAFRIPRGQWLRAIVLPTALPKIFAGLRISLSLALIMMVISELVGATNGIGHTMTLAQFRFDYTQLWAGIVLLGVLGYALNAALQTIEKRVLHAFPQ